jgi:hypothetical protein
MKGHPLLLVLTAVQHMPPYAAQVYDAPLLLLYVGVRYPLGGLLLWVQLVLLGYSTCQVCLECQIVLIAVLPMLSGLCRQLVSRCGRRDLRSGLADLVLQADPYGKRIEAMVVEAAEASLRRAVQPWCNSSQGVQVSLAMSSVFVQCRSLLQSTV